MAVNLNFTGPTTSIRIVKEATYGTDPGTGYAALGVYQAEVSSELTTDNESIYALGARAAQSIVGKTVKVTGSIRGVFQDATLLAFALGCDAVDGAGPYNHWLNYKTAEATSVEKFPAGFTMVVTRGTDNATYDIVETYTGCRIDKLVLKGGLDAPLQVDVDFIAKNVSSNTSGNQTASFSSDEVHPPQKMSFELPSATAISQVQNFELTVNNNLNPVYALGSQILQALPARTLEIGLTGTVAFTDEAVWAMKEITNDSSAAYTFPSTGATSAPKTNETCQLSITNSGATTLERTLQVNLSSVAFNRWSTSAKVDEVTMLDFEANIADFTQTGWGATPSGAPIKYINNTAGTYVGTTGGV